MSYGSVAPAYVHAIPEHEFDERVALTEDLCVIDKEYFFIRGNIYIPVQDSTEEFSWGVWSSVSKENFMLMLENWETEGRERIVPPAFGYLSLPLPVYPDTMNLNMRTHTMPLGEVPSFELEPTDHPLAVEQREGITMARVHEIAKLVMGDNS